MPGFEPGFEPALGGGQNGSRNRWRLTRPSSRRPLWAPPSTTPLLTRAPSPPFFFLLQLHPGLAVFYSLLQSRLVSFLPPRHAHAPLVPPTAPAHASFAPPTVCFQVSLLALSSTGCNDGAILGQLVGFAVRNAPVKKL